MRHLFKKTILAAVIVCGNMGILFAQQMPPVPMDAQVRVGKLDNGLTYYIRHNEKPENRVEFHIAQKVGSILEEPQQRGLAHFLEHMAFNGTKNFPGDERGLGIVQWCETKGIKFGVNLNAYTSVDETVYRISNVPSTDASVVDSCLLILHDWSNAILLADKEIDKERGVIREEWRSRNSGMLRLYTEAQPVIYPDSKYSDCMPIGSIDVINNFPYQDIRDYYAKWYRPDLQGIIIVGDIDVDQMEAKIKSVFADVKKPVNPAERVYYPVPDNAEPLIYIGKDKEIDSPSIDIYFKHDATPDSIKGTMAYLVQDYLMSTITMMLNERLSELAQSANPPYVNAGSYYGNFFLSKTKEAFNISGRANTKNDSYVNECIQHFLDAEPMPGIEYEYTVFNQIAPNIPVALVNQIVQSELIPDNNEVVIISAPDKEGEVIPTKEEVLAQLNGMKQLDVKPYEDKVSNEPLMKEAPKGGKIVSEKADAIYGTTELTLSNGVKVYVKKTDFKADEIRMSAFSLGGTSLLPDSDKLNFNQGILNGVISAGGLGDFSNVELTKMLAGKKVSVDAGVGGTQEYVHGNCSPKDFETMMQLTYLSFTAPRKDMEAFASFKTRLKAQLENAAANPLSSINDTITSMMYGNHPRYLSLKPELIDQIDYDRVLQIYKERFANAGDFTFFLVGNIDLEQMKPLIEQYLGALPSTGAKETVRDNHMDIAKGILNKTYAKEQQTPMATVFMLYSGDCKYDLKNNLLMSFLTQALDMVYTEEIREKEGGTYGVSCYGGLNKYPTEDMMMQIVYQTDPDKFEKLNSIIDREMKEMATEGPSDEHMQKIKEYMLKKYNDNQKENSYWVNNLKEYFCNGVDNTKDYVETINAISKADVQKFAADLQKQGNKITVVMTVPDKK